jgi:hypothetical protein
VGGNGNGNRERVGFGDVWLGLGWDSQGLVRACVWPRPRLNLGERNERGGASIDGIGSLVHAAQLDSTQLAIPRE